MKYIIEAIQNTKAKYYLVLQILCQIVMAVIIAIELKIVTVAIDTNEYRWVNLYLFVVILCIIAEPLTQFCEIYRLYLSNYLQEKLYKKILQSDYEMFIKHSTADIHTTVGGIHDISMFVSMVIRFIKYISNIIVTIIFIYTINKIIILPVLFTLFILVLIAYKILKSWYKLDKKLYTIRKMRNTEAFEIVEVFQEIKSYQTSKIHFRNLMNLIKNSFSITTQKKKYSYVISLNTSFICNVIFCYNVTLYYVS